MNSFVLRSDALRPDDFGLIQFISLFDAAVRDYNCSTLDKAKHSNLSAFEFKKIT